MITGGGGGSSTPAFAFGTAAARPAAAAGNADTGYFATDTGEITFSDGTAWHAVEATSASTLTVSGGSGTAALQHLNVGGGASVGFGNQNSVLTYLSLDVGSAGYGLRVAEGTNAKQGTATLAAGTVTVSNTSVTANSRIILTAQDNNITGALRVSARTAGTSFTITSSNAADSGVVAYQIFEPG